MLPAGRVLLGNLTIALTRSQSGLQSFPFTAQLLQSSRRGLATDIGTVHHRLTVIEPKQTSPVTPERRSVSTLIIIKHLSQTITNSELQKAFQSCGEVLRARELGGDTGSNRRDRGLRLQQVGVRARLDIVDRATRNVQKTEECVRGRLRRVVENGDGRVELAIAVLVCGQDGRLGVCVVHRKRRDSLGHVVNVLLIDLDQATVDVSLRVRLEGDAGDDAVVVERALRPS